jgi:RNA polymerase sigma factor (sigma-70 family)
MTAAEAHRAILAVWRIEQPRLITSLARMVRDVPLAEDLTQEALLAALELWPETGVPERPGAWLMMTARRRALDHLRRDRMLERKHEMIAWEIEAAQQAMPDLDSALDDDIGDELLRLIFTACHPILSREARAALALRMICGLTTEEIAKAFLLPAATIAQRIVRAKRTLSESGLAYEAHGLLALMELNASRAAARTDEAGDPILIAEQNRALWDQLQIRRGMQALERARKLGGAGGVYALQAAIVACHAAIPTGRASPGSIPSWRRSSARQSSTSIARLPSAWPMAQKRR